MKKRFLLHERNEIACWFQVEKFRADGSITYLSPWFKNTILDVGLDALVNYPLSTSEAGAGGILQYANVGTDSTAPSTSQTGLLSFLASTRTDYGDVTTGYQTSGPVFKWIQKIYEFSVGSCTGNLTEVGLSRDSNSNYFNRQLFRDSNGDPTTITVLSDEGLRVTARVYLYSDINLDETVAGSFLLNSETTINTTREITNNFWTNAGIYGIIALNKTPSIRITTSGTAFDGGTGGSVTPQSYVSGSFYRDYEAYWAAGNFVGDIASVLFYCYHADHDAGGYQAPLTAFRLDPVISLADTQEFYITLRREWGRYAA